MMTARARRQTGPQHAPGYLYYWLLLALFLEYARPASYVPVLNIPFIYSAIPLLLMAVSLGAPGLRPIKELFDDRLTKWVMILLGVLALSWLTHLSTFSFDKLKAVLGYVFFFLLIARIATTAARLRGVFITLMLAHLLLIAVNPAVIMDPNERHYITGATFLGDGNDFSLSLCILFPLAIELAQSRRRWWSKGLCWGVLGLLVLAIIGTQSRGGTLGMAAVLFFLWAHSPRKSVGLIGVVIVAVGVLAYAPSVYFQRMSTIKTYQSDGSAQGRIDAWKAGLGMALHNPVLGVGAGHFGPRWGKTAHSSYILPLAELGVPGLWCVLVIIFGNMRDNMRVRGRLLEPLPPSGNKAPSASEPAPSEVAAMDAERATHVRLLTFTTAAMLGFAVAGAFLSATYYPHIYVLSGVLVSIRHLALSTHRRQLGLLGLPDLGDAHGARRRPRFASKTPNSGARARVGGRPASQRR